MNPELTDFIHGLLVQGGWLGLVIIVDLVLGILVALKQHLFKFDKVADFLVDYGIKIVSWVGLECLGLLPDELQVLGNIGEGLGIGAYALILLSAVASILGHVQAIGILPAKSIPGVAPTKKGEGQE